MKKGILKRFNINKDSLRKLARQALSPAFLLILLGSFLLWYTSKLSYNYTTNMPLTVRIDGQKYKLTAEVEGRGSELMGQKLSLKGIINLKLEELSPKQSAENPGSFSINEKKLLESINGRVKELKVTKIIDAPEFTPEPPKESRKEKRERERSETEENIQQTPELAE